MRSAALVCLLVVLAGCGGAGAPAAVDSGPPAETPADGSTAREPTPTATRTPTARGTTATRGVADNPWNADPVTVAVVAPANSTRGYRPLVERTLRFWENESTGVDLDYRVVAGGDADVTVRFVADIARCGGRDDRTVGCAPQVPAGGIAPDPTVVRVETGYTDESTLATLKHEFGHTLGYTHDDADGYGFMAAAGESVRLPQPNATSLDDPWRKGTLLVHADYPDLISTQRTEYEDAVERALAFYRTDERSTLPSGVSLETTTNRSAADVVVGFSIGGESRSVGEGYGYDNDSDPALERYTRYEIRVSNVDHDRVAWHVGYWLGWAFGAETRADLPEPFDDPETDDREGW